MSPIVQSEFKHYTIAWFVILSPLEPSPFIGAIQLALDHLDRDANEGLEFDRHNNAGRNLDRERLSLVMHC